MRLLLLILLTSAICSCRSVKYVPVETVRHDTAYIHQVQRDSILRYDSVYIKEKGDTVRVEKFRYLYRDRLLHDTLYLTRTDSIQVPYPVEVEKRLTLWQRIKVSLGGFAIAALLLLVAYTLWRGRR